MGDTKDTVKGGIWVDLYVKVSIDIAVKSTDKDDYVDDRFSAKAWRKMGASSFFWLKVFSKLQQLQQKSK